MTEATRELERSIRGLNWTYALIGAATRPREPKLRTVKEVIRAEPVAAALDE